MKRHVLLLFVCLLLLRCSSQPIAGWSEAGYKHLDRFKGFFMAGEDPLAEAHFQKAIHEIKKSGDLSILQRAYLTRCAVNLAVLNPLNGDEYLRIEALEPIAKNRNFFAFLRAAPPAEVSAELLPAQYREVFTVFARGTAEEENDVVAKIEDPLSRLIAVGWLVTQGRYNEALLLRAIDTASREGWKKALLAYLDKLHTHYTARNEMDKARKVEERIRLIAK